jgi:protein ImuB
MRLTDAEALWPARASVRFEAHDPQADRQRLKELAVLAQQFSPIVAVDDSDPPDCLLLDATGCGFGFGGEQLFAEKLVAAVRKRGYWGVAALADTITAAWAVSRRALGRRLLAADVASRVIVIAPNEQKSVLLPLAIEALRLPPRIVEVLHELNIVRVDQLLALPRNQLPSRFGAELLLSIDRAFGVLPEGLTAEPDIEPLELSWAFEPPVSELFSMTAAIEEMIERLLKRIRGQQVGIQQLLWWAKPEKGERVCFPVVLVRPTLSQLDLMALIRLQLERLQVTGEIAEVAVRAAVAPLHFDQGDLFGTRPDGRAGIAGLLERLTSRLGDKAVLRPRLYPDAQPEFACQYDPWLSSITVKTPHTACATYSPLTRPPMLKPIPVAVSVLSVFPGGQPRRVRWGSRDLDVARSWGPERIETGWWRGADVRRDYYVAETTAGERFWVFRDLCDGGWFLHGVYA